MPIFTIVFERRDPAGNHDYQPLLRELQGHKCFPLWENAWLASFENSATQVHNYFKRLLAEADRIAVCEMTNHFCYSGVVQGANKWLELNPPAGAGEGAQAHAPAAAPEQSAKNAAPAGKRRAKAEAKTSPKRASPEATASRKPKAATTKPPAAEKRAKEPAKSGGEGSAAGSKPTEAGTPAKAKKAAKRT